MIVRILAPVVCLTLCGSPWGAPSGLRVETRMARLAYGSKLWVRNRNGAIKVTGWAKEEVLLTALVRDSGKRRIDLVLTRLGDDLDIEAHYQQPALSFSFGFVSSPRCEMTLSVPYKLLAHFRTTNGAIAVTNLAGYARCETTNGDITLCKLSGEAVAETSNGSVEARELKARLKGGTSNGGIRLQDVEGMVKLETTNGEIQARNLDGWGEGINLSTVDGTIAVRLGEAKGNLEARTVDGAIHASNPGLVLDESRKNVLKGHIPGRVQRIRLKTVDGRIQID